MARRYIPDVIIDDARLMWRNFDARPDKFNPDGGKRNFCIFLSPEDAQRMIDDGWNVKVLQPKEEGDTEQAYIKVNVSFKFKEPRCVLITPRLNPATGEWIDVKNPLPEQLVGMMDMVDIGRADVKLNPYIRPQADGSISVTAYLKSIFLTVAVDDLEARYAALPEIEFNAPLQITAGGEDDQEPGIIDVESWEEDDS